MKSIIVSSGYRGQGLEKVAAAPKAAMAVEPDRAVQDQRRGGNSLQAVLYFFFTYLPSPPPSSRISFPAPNITETAQDTEWGIIWVVPILSHPGSSESR
jgi:hypothetical protein